MDIVNDLKDRIFSVDDENFDELALDIFRFQVRENDVYGDFIRYLKIKPEQVKKVAQIPFLPIQFFKSARIITRGLTPHLVFESTGTTSTGLSTHLVADKDLYVRSLRLCFSHFFGDPSEYCFLALLPGYLERSSSSLVFMMNELMIVGKREASGFYLNEFDRLASNLETLLSAGRKVMLWGVSFALMDFAEQYPMDLSGAIVVETGGMKGRRKEVLREELQSYLCRQFNLSSIASEYGMTELLSQAYSLHDGLFRTPPWMRLLIREPNDPFAFLNDAQTGGVNIIDLANLHSCSFIAAQDLGRTYPDGSFEILGRFDNADIRGCSLMYN